MILVTSLLIWTGCGSSRHAEVSYRVERPERRATWSPEREQFDDDVVSATAAHNAATGYYVASGTAANAAANFQGPEGPAAVPVAEAGGRTYPLVQIEGVFYLVRHTKEGPVIGSEWPGQVAWVNSPRALADARAGARDSTRIEREALALESKRQREKTKQRRETLGFIEDVAHGVIGLIPR